MAVGDIVSGQDNVPAGTFTFQPAAGVEIMITWVTGYSLSYYGLTDGANTSLSFAGYNTTEYFGGNNTKLGITNALYFTVNANATYGGFSGIQIK